MKKILTACIAVLMLTAGCSKKPNTDPVPTADTRESASIADIDFTQADAEKVVNTALAAHCGSVSCKVTSVRISGSDLYATYTYTVDGAQKDAEAVLYGVSVKPSDKTKYTASREEYNDSIPSVIPAGDDGEETAAPTETPESKDDDGKSDDKSDSSSGEGKYDLPDKVDEKDENAKDDQKVYDENGIQIWRVYSSKGKIEFTGKYTGDSKFIIQIMDLKQNVRGEPVNMKKSGDIEASMKLDEEGYYYIKIEASGGWELYWNRIYE